MLNGVEVQLIVKPKDKPRLELGEEVLKNIKENGRMALGLGRLSTFFLLLRLHICSFARDAAAVQAARGLRAVRVALTGVAFRAI